MSTAKAPAGTSSASNWLSSSGYRRACIGGYDPQSARKSWLGRPPDRRNARRRPGGAGRGSDPSAPSTPGPRTARPLRAQQAHPPSGRSQGQRSASSSGWPAAIFATFAGDENRPRKSAIEFGGQRLAYGCLAAPAYPHQHHNHLVSTTNFTASVPVVRRLPGNRLSPGRQLYRPGVHPCTPVRHRLDSSMLPNCSPRAKRHQRWPRAWPVATTAAATISTPPAIVRGAGTFAQKREREGNAIDRLQRRHHAGDVRADLPQAGDEQRMCKRGAQDPQRQQQRDFAPLTQLPGPSGSAAPATQTVGSKVSAANRFCQKATSPADLRTDCRRFITVSPANVAPDRRPTAARSARDCVTSYPVPSTRGPPPPTLLSPSSGRSPLTDRRGARSPA